MQHKLWLPPRLHQDISSEEERKVTWLELFYDLVYVATLIQLGNTLSEDVSLPGFLQFVLLFIPIWWAWTGITFFMNRFVVDDVWHRSLIFLQMIGITILAISVEGAFSELGGQFALAYAWVRLVLILLYVRAWRYAPKSKPLIQRYVISYSISVILWVISAFLPQPYNIILWIAALVVEIGNIFTPKTRHLLSLLPPDPHHMIERYGIFTIIVLGESFIKTITAGSGLSMTLDLLIFSFFGIGIAFGLWWLYFDDVGGAEIRPASWSPYVWIYSHLPLAIGLTAFGVAAKKLFLEVPAGHVKHQYLILYCFAVALYGIALALINLATERQDGTRKNNIRAYWRLGMAIVVALVGWLGSDLSPVQFILIIAAIISVQIVAELYPAYRLSARQPSD